MWYIILIFVLIAGVFFGCKFKTGNNHDKVIIIDDIENDSLSDNTSDGIKPMYSKKNIEDKLKILAETEPPEELAKGAMCYSEAMAQDTAKYICTTCGEKTLYKRDEHKNGYQMVELCLNELYYCRTELENIKGLNIELDESQFCKNCSPDIESPELCLLVNISGKKDTSKVCNVHYKDLRLINEFLHNKFKHKGSYDEEYPLVNYIDRIQQLLGVEQ